MPQKLQRKLLLSLTVTLAALFCGDKTLAAPDFEDALKESQAKISAEIDKHRAKEAVFAKREKELLAKIADVKPISYCVSTIKAGKPIQANQVETREFHTGGVPGDAATTSVVGKVSKYDIQEGQIISVRDFGAALTAAQLNKCIAHDYKNYKGQTKRIVLARTAIAKGQIFNAAQLAESVVPVDLAPISALTSPLLIEGRRAKFDINKFEIINQHLLTRP